MDEFGLPSELTSMYQPILKRADKLGYGTTTTETHPELLVNALTNKANLELGIARLKTDTALQISQIQSNNAMAQEHLQLERDKFQYMKEANTPSLGEKLMGLATGALQGFVAGKNFSTSASNPNGTGTGEAIGAIAGGALAFAGSSGTRAGQENTMGMLNSVAELSNTYKQSQQASIAADATKSLTDMLSGLHKQSTGVGGTPADPGQPNNASLSNPQPGAGVDNATAYQQRQSALNAYKDKLAPLIGNDAAQKRRDQIDKNTMDPTNPLENPEHFKDARVASRLGQYEAIKNPDSMDYARLKHDLQGFELHDAITSGTASAEALQRWNADKKALDAGQLPSAPSVVPAPKSSAEQEPGVLRPHPVQQQAAPNQQAGGRPLEIEQLDAQGNTIGRVPTAATPAQSVAPSGPVPTPADLSKEGNATVQALNDAKQPLEHEGIMDKLGKLTPWTRTEVDKRNMEKEKYNAQLDNEVSQEQDRQRTIDTAAPRLKAEKAISDARIQATEKENLALNPGVKEDRQKAVDALNEVKDRVDMLPDKNMAQQNKKAGLTDATEALNHMHDDLEKMPEGLMVRATEAVKAKTKGTFLLDSPHISSDSLRQGEQILNDLTREGKFTPEERDMIAKYRQDLFNLTYADAQIDAGPKAPRADMIEVSKQQMPTFEDSYREKSRKLALLARDYREKIIDSTKTAGDSQAAEKLDLQYKRLRNAKMAGKASAPTSHDLFGGVVTSKKFKSPGFTSTDDVEADDSSGD
jgi:hypothetical protein